MKSMRFVAFALAALCLRAQTALSPDLAALAQIRARMLYNLKHQPNYTCLETIERSERKKLTNKLKIVDTLRLEVALVDGRELFAWPGSKKFEDSDVTQMVPTGAIGNGNFGTHAQALFGTRAATFHYRGTEDYQGAKAVRFDYIVPQMLSGYRIRVASASAIVGYHGSFYADPLTSDMKRIEVVADDLPPQLMLASTEDKIEYAVARIGASDFLLPAQSELSMVGLNGGEEHNLVKFSSCREFTGQSTITFEDTTAAKPDAAPLPVREFDLPEGLAVELVTIQEIDLQTAAIGDAVGARLNRDVKHKGEILLPKGATATGRITRIEKYDTFLILGVEFSEIESPGILARMNATLADITGPTAPRRLMRPSRPKQPREGLIQVNLTQRHLFKGCIMLWRT
jgi:hypothetical protein